MRHMRSIHFVAVVVLVSTLPLPLYGQARVSCSDYGAAIYCSNGLSAIRSGNVVYFSDGTTVMQSGNSVYINENTQANQNYQASYAAGTALGNVVGAVISDVHQHRKFERACDYDPYAHGWIMGRPAFCSEAAIRDACPQLTDFSGFKYSGDQPHKIGWVESGGLGTATVGSLVYFPAWPHGNSVPCVADVGGHAIHEANLWLAHLREAQPFLPSKSDDDVARILVWLYAHPGDYDVKHKDTMYKKLSGKLLRQKS
jgi:hypothetical protein